MPNGAGCDRTGGDVTSKEECLSAVIDLGYDGSGDDGGHDVPTLDNTERPSMCFITGSPPGTALPAGTNYAPFFNEVIQDGWNQYEKPENFLSICKGIDLPFSYNIAF